MHSLFEGMIDVSIENGHEADETAAESADPLVAKGLSLETPRSTVCDKQSRLIVPGCCACRRRSSFQPLICLVCRGSFRFQLFSMSSLCSLCLPSRLRPHHTCRTGRRHSPSPAAAVAPRTSATSSRSALRRRLSPHSTTCAAPGGCPAHEVQPLQSSIRLASSNCSRHPCYPATARFIFCSAAASPDASALHCEFRVRAPGSGGGRESQRSRFELCRQGETVRRRPLAAMEWRLPVILCREPPDASARVSRLRCPNLIDSIARACRTDGRLSLLRQRRGVSMCSMCCFARCKRINISSTYLRQPTRCACATAKSSCSWQPVAAEKSKLL